MASTSPAKKADKDKDLTIVSRDDEEATFRARIFGETFLFSSDANGWLRYMASTGQAEHMEKLIKSILLPEAITDDMDETQMRMERFKEWQRFDELLGSQQEFGIERMFRLVNDLIEATGNDQ
jgi:hypothetical protein